MSAIDPNRWNELVLAVARSRDQSAFAELFNHFAPRVKAFVMRLGIADGQADDLAQEVMLTVWRRAETFDPRQAGAATWIFTIARNRRIDLLRRDRKPELDAEDPALRPPEPPDQEAAFSQGQQAGAVREALVGLSEDQADLVRRAFFGGLTHRAIAEQTGLPLGTVKSRIRLALLHLRRKLGPEP